MDQEQFGAFDILLGAIGQEFHLPHVFFTRDQVF